MVLPRASLSELLSLAARSVPELARDDSRSRRDRQPRRWFFADVGDCLTRFQLDDLICNVKVSIVMTNHENGLATSLQIRK